MARRKSNGKMARKLQIEEISEKYFDGFRKQHLDEKVLSNKALSLIKSLFDLDPRNTQTVRVSCDEQHAHSYRCFGFKDRNSAVVLRLLDEIEMYQEKLDRIKKESDYKK